MPEGPQLKLLQTNSPRSHRFRHFGPCAKILPAHETSAPKKSRARQSSFLRDPRRSRFPDCLYGNSPDAMVLARPRRSQATEESPPAFSERAQFRQKNLPRQMRELPRRYRQRRWPRCRQVRSPARELYRSEAHERRHRRRALLQNQRRQKAHARLQNQVKRRRPLAPRPPHPLFRAPAKHSASPPVGAQHRCAPSRQGVTLLFACGFYRLLASCRVSLWAEVGSARNRETVGPTEMQSRLMCPHGESSVITGAPIAAANSCAGVGFTI